MYACPSSLALRVSTVFSPSVLPGSLEWSDTNVYEPHIRARLETAAHFVGSRKRHAGAMHAPAILLRIQGYLSHNKTPTLRTTIGPQS